MKFIFYTIILNLKIVYDHRVLKLMHWFPHCCEDTSFDETRLESYSDHLECSSSILVLCFWFILGGEWWWYLLLEAGSCLILWEERDTLRNSFRTCMCDANCIGYYSDYSYGFDESCLSWILGNCHGMIYWCAQRRKRNTRIISVYLCWHFCVRRSSGARRWRLTMIEDGRKQFEVKRTVYQLYSS